MKIAQITFYKTMNYGGTLQAYALNKVLTTFGDCECIDYTNANLSPKGIKAFLQKFIYYKRKRAFDKFIKRYIHTSKTYDDLDSMGKDYDYYVCGSDQIWNPDMMGVNCTPFVRQYDILSNKWGVLLCQKEYQTNDIRQNSKNW